MSDLPWKIELENQGVRGKRENITIVARRGVVARVGDTGMPGAREDAELIVRAVNNFDALVQELQTAIAWIEERNTPSAMYAPTAAEILPQLRAALAKAGAL